MGDTQVADRLAEHPSMEVASNSVTEVRRFNIPTVAPPRHGGYKQIGPWLDQGAALKKGPPI